jgi:uncharacterized membrane protein YoaK (UPF0700 family)
MALKSDCFKNILSRENVFLWLLLAFQAGYVNAAGFIACHRFVSHMTGFGTQMSLSLAEGKLLAGFEMLLAPVSFILGCILSAILIDKRLHTGKEAHVRTSAMLQCGLLLLVLIGGNLEIFGEFGEPLELQRDFALLFILCFMCGMQNATFTSLTNGQIRTTHLTGLSTDLGIHFIRNRYVDVPEEKREELVQVNWLRLYTFASFFTGSAISALVMIIGEYQGFLLPVGTSLIIVLYIHYVLYRKKNCHQDSYDRAERKLQA